MACGTPGSLFSVTVSGNPFQKRIRTTYRRSPAGTLRLLPRGLPDTRAGTDKPQANSMRLPETVQKK
jgi:hypothetical protein